MTVYNLYTFDSYLISYPDTVFAKIFEDEPGKGIIFYTEEAKFEIINNKYMGNRLLINFADGSWKDVPFHSGTFAMLPSYIKIEEL